MWAAGLEPYSPLILAVSGLLPGFGFWTVYRSRPGADGAPEPDWWEHQLGSLGRDHGDRRLDAKRFAGKALELSKKSEEK